MTTHIAVIANGLFTEEDAKKIAEFPMIVAVNGGTLHCQKWKFTPTLIIGDLDSSNEEILHHFQNVPRIEYPKEKNETDLEIAIEYIFDELGDEITVFGATGKRTDHTLYNLKLLSRHPGNLFYLSQNEKMFVIDERAELICTPGQTISLIPLNGPVIGVTTSGLQWELYDYTLDQDFMSISNVCIKEKVSVSIESGDLLCALQY